MTTHTRTHDEVGESRDSIYPDHLLGPFPERYPSGRAKNQWYLKCKFCNRQVMTASWRELEHAEACKVELHPEEFA